MPKVAPRIRPANAPFADHCSLLNSQMIQKGYSTSIQKEVYCQSTDEVSNRPALQGDLQMVQLDAVTPIVYHFLPHILKTERLFPFADLAFEGG